MKISEHIAILQAIQAEHGDLEVETLGVNGRCTAHAPIVAYRKILGKREKREDFWASWFSKDEGKQGEKVCRI